MGVHVNTSGHRGRYNNSKVGVFKPIHPEKYIGSSGQIVFKSGLEQKMMRYLDRNPNIVKWAYEKFSIKYQDMTSRPPKTRNYYIDFVAYIKDGHGGLRQIWIEVKSSKEVTEPKKEKVIEHNTWIKNQCKWKSAQLIAESRGCKFKVITEKELD